jgi:hypothetical protein
MHSPRSASDNSRMVCSISACLACSASKVPVRAADRPVLGPGSPAGLAGGRTDRGRAGPPTDRFQQLPRDRYKESICRKGASPN